MRALKGIFIGIVLGLVCLFLINFCTSFIKFYSGGNVNEIDNELNPIYHTEIEDELIREVKMFKDFDKTREENARRTLRRYRLNKELENRIKERNEWRKREGRINDF